MLHNKGHFEKEELWSAPEAHPCACSARPFNSPVPIGASADHAIIGFLRCCVVCGWAPDGRHFLTATTAPRTDGSGDALFCLRHRYTSNNCRNIHSQLLGPSLGHSFGQCRRPFSLTTSITSKNIRFKSLKSLKSYIWSLIILLYLFSDYNNK